LLAAALSLGSSLGLSGCASISEKFAETASEAPQIGLPANTPARPAQQMTYPAVHDIPPPRTAVVLTDMEQQKLETDLLAARNHQQAAAGVTLSLAWMAAKERAAKKQATKDPGKQAAKNATKSKADRNQGAASQASQGQADQDQASAPAPISASSSRTIY